VFGAQANGREAIIEIFDDDVGLDDDLAVVIDRRDDALLIDLAVERLPMLEREQVDMLALEGDLLFGEAHPHLLRANRTPIVIQRDHARSSPATAAWLRPGGMV